MTQGFSISSGSLINPSDKDLLYTPRHPKGIGAIFCHGANGLYSDSQRTQSGLFNLCQRMALLGYHVFSSDWGGLQTWGNDVSVARIEAARQVLIGFGCAPKIVLTGASMGNLNIMRYMADHPDRVICGVGIIGAIDIEQMRSTGAGIGATPFIEQSWALSPTDPIPNRGIPKNRVSDMTSVPWAIWFGGADSVVDSSDAFEMAASLGSDSIAVQYDNTLQHGDALIKLCPWNNVIEWIDARVVQSGL